MPLSFKTVTVRDSALRCPRPSATARAERMSRIRPNSGAATNRTAQRDRPYHFISSAWTSTRDFPTLKEMINVTHKNLTGTRQVL
jgi:hypothetical protein